MVRRWERMRGFPCRKSPPHRIRRISSNLSPFLPSAEEPPRFPLIRHSLRRATFPRGEGFAFRHPNISKSSPKGIPHLISFVLIGFPQQADKLEFARMSAAQYLPPGGRGTAKRWMRNGDTLPFAMQSSQRVQPFPMYLFNEMHTDSKQIAVPHPPQCAHWGTFPPGEGIALRRPCKHQFIGQLRKTDVHNILYLRSLRLRRRATAKGCLL